MRLTLLIGWLALAGPAGAEEPVDMADQRTASAVVSVALSTIRAHQDGRTSRRDERAIVEVFEALSGTELHELKVALDAEPTDGDLMHLVWSDLDSAGYRRQLLEHLAEAAAGAPRRIRVLSDIDDTIYARLRDERFEKGAVYPGVTAFHREIGLATGVPTDRAGEITFVSARPGDRLGVVEHATLEMLDELGFSGATLLAGRWSQVHTHAAMADAKYDNFVRYQQLYPEYRYVFVGDSGQGDATFGARIRADFPDAVLAVFIHDLVGDGKEHTTEAERASAADDGLDFFDSYAGAAVRAHDLGLLDREAVSRVIAATRSDLDALEFAHQHTRAVRHAEVDAEVAAFEAAAVAPLE